MSVPSYLVDPVDHSPLAASARGLSSAAGRLYPAAAGGWDFRPGANVDENKALQAEIYDAKLGEVTDFDHPHNLMLVHQRGLLELLPAREGERVLEIGGHRSGVLPWLERRRGVVGVGLDISRTWVEAQNTFARQRGSETQWVLGDAERMPFADRSFASVVSFDVFEHLSNLDRALAECFRVLRPGGMLVAHMLVRDIAGSLDGLQRWLDPADFAARQATAGHFHERMPTRLEVRTLLEHAGFQVRDVRSFNVWLQPVHDHKLMPLLGRLRHGTGGRGGGRRKGDPPRRPDVLPRAGASGFQKAYAASVVPLLRLLTAPDRIGSALGIGGSCSYVAVRPEGA